MGFYPINLSVYQYSLIFSLSFYPIPVGLATDLA